jgi:hypothetical protein
MGVIAYFVLVTSPLWILYIVVALGESPNRDTLLWLAMGAVVACWLLIESLSSGALFGMLRVFQTAPAVISLVIAGLALYASNRSAKAGAKHEKVEENDAA